MTRLPLYIIALLLLLLFLKDCGSLKPVNTVTVMHDTVDHIIRDTVTHSSPAVVKTIPVPGEKVTEVLHDTLKVKEVVDDYYATRVQRDSLLLKDSLGVVKATTFTSQNQVDSIHWETSIRERTVTNTVAKEKPTKPHFLYGFSLGSNAPFTSLNQLGAGILLQNKKGNILGLEGAYNLFFHAPVISLHYYKNF